MSKKKQKRRKRCDDCGLLKDDVEDTTCPYAEDVNNEEVPVKLCKDCYLERAADI